MDATRFPWVNNMGYTAVHGTPKTLRDRALDPARVENLLIRENPVAMLVGEHPTVLQVDVGANGYYGYEVMDTCRPTPDSEVGDTEEPS
jgi:hypothetical protein